DARGPKCSAHQVEYHVHPSTRGPPRHGFGEALGAMLERVAILETELSCAEDLLLRSRRSERDGLPRTSDLYSGQPDAAPNGENEHVLACPQPRLRDQSVVGGDKCLGGCAGLLPVERIGHCGDRVWMYADYLCVRATTDQTENAVSLAPPGSFGAQCRHGSGEFESRDVLWHVVRRREAAHALVQVGAVQRRGVHAHQHLVLAR